MIPNGKEMNWNGHHLVFESEPDRCRGCFFADKDSCPDCDEGAWVEDSPWCTGIPTEEGWYLIKYKWNGEIRYIAADVLVKTFVEDSRTIGWQKIDEGDKEK